MDVLALPLADGVPDLGVPDDVEVRRVTDEQTVRDAIVVGNDAFGGDGPDATSRSASALAEVERGLARRLGRALGRLRRRASRRHRRLHARRRRVPSLGRRHAQRAARARGLPRRARRPAAAARAAGATLGLTHGVVDTSSPILRRIGFTRYGEERTLVLDLTVSRHRLQHDHVSLEWDERGGVTVHMDGSPQSHVQPDDPTLLVFEYVQHLALAIDALPAGAARRHARRRGRPHPAPLGRGHPSGVAADRPRAGRGADRPRAPRDPAPPAPPHPRAPGRRAHRGASARRRLGRRRRDRCLRGRARARGTGRGGIRPRGRPGAQADRDGPLEPGRRARDALGRKGASRRWPRRCRTSRVIATHEVLKGRRFGNSVLVASAAPLPVGGAASRRRPGQPADRAARGRGARRGCVAGAKPFDDKGMQSPPPPEAGRWRAR